MSTTLRRLIEDDLSELDELYPCSPGQAHVLRQTPERFGLDMSIESAVSLSSLLRRAYRIRCPSVHAGEIKLL